MHIKYTLIYYHSSRNSMKGCEMGFGMWLIPILFVIILFYVLKANNRGKSKTSSAQDILDKRFANGEIDLQEYGEKSHILKKHY